MKKILSLILVLALSLALMLGCSGTPNTPNTPNTPDEKVSLTVDPDIEAEISILVPSGNDNEKTMINCLLDDFSLMFPNVTVSMRYVSTTNYESSIRQMAAAGTLPDIIWSNSPDFYYLVNKNLAANLNGYIEASEAAGVFDFDETFYTEFFDCGSLDGNLYCIPRSCDSVVVFYNKEMFKAAGVDMTKVVNGWTWDDFLDACAKLRTYFDANGKSGDYIVDANLTAWLSVNYPMLLSYGGEAIDENGNVVIDSAATKECLQMVRSMVANRYIVDSSKSSGSSFETGTSAMLFQSASFSHYAERKALKGKIDLVSFPLITDNNTPKIGCGIAGYAINNKSEYKDLCWQFLNLILSKDGQQEMALNGLNVASIRKDLSDHKTANWGKQYADYNLSAYVYGSEYMVDASFLSRVNLAAKADISSAINDLFSYAQDASRDIDDAIASCKENMQDAIDNAED